MLSAKHLGFMPKGQGQKRPTDVASNAVRVMQIATGQIEVEESDRPKNQAAAELGSRGGKARAQNLSKTKRREIARSGAAARWGKKNERVKKR